METDAFDNAGVRLAVTILLAVMAACALGAMAMVLTGYAWV